MAGRMSDAPAADARPRRGWRRRLRAEDGTRKRVRSLPEAPSGGGRWRRLLRRWRRDDVMLAALGVTLGLISALFPWYIFFNPDKFGPPAMRFEGRTDLASGPAGAAVPLGRPFADWDGRGDTFAAEKLDLFATGATPTAEHAPAPPAEQPFPAAEPPVFRLVHVSEGRAMIADDAGVWVVMEGDVLPDNSRVARIGEEGGEPVLETSEKRLLRLEP